MALTGPKLAECLTGKTDAVSLLFKGSVAQKIMEDYYCNSPMLSTLTEQMVTFLNTIATNSNASPNNPVRILEVGAGFGGTTTRLAEVLQTCGTPVEYTFTDIAPSLIKGAKTKFAKYDWMKFQTFNLENEPPATLLGQFDIIIGTNCVHATANKTESVGRLKKLLRKNGFIVLSEVTRLVDWYDIVFGLLDGWWLAKIDPYPIQPAESWMASFKEVGFENMSYSRGPSPESNTQRLLIASLREVRQPPPTAPDSFIREGGHTVETVVYKDVDGIEVGADVYLPQTASHKAMPIGTAATRTVHVYI